MKDDRYWKRRHKIASEEEARRIVESMEGNILTQYKYLRAFNAKFVCISLPIWIEEEYLKWWIELIQKNKIHNHPVLSFQAHFPFNCCRKIKFALFHRSIDSDLPCCRLSITLNYIVALDISIILKNHLYFNALKDMRCKGQGPYLWMRSMWSLVW